MSESKNFKYFDLTSGFSLNLSAMYSYNIHAESMPNMDKINTEMVKIESGAIKNPDENRKVSHFTDRIDYCSSTQYAQVEKFAKKVQSGLITSSTNDDFEYLVVNGIGGSALGPQLMNFSINGPYWNELNAEKRNNYLKIYFTDNTDSSGINDILDVVDLKRTIILTISKSGGTQETKNNMLAFEQAFAKLKIPFAGNAVAITMKNSKLYNYASENSWLKIFEMADSIGGRTSETSIVGHLPAALTAVNFSAFINGACYMDTITRKPEISENPAYMLALAWYFAGEGKGNKNMVIIPYSDRLLLFSRYLQQLVMESIGKKLDLDGNIVHQGLNVFGNKGGTDAHAFIQQLNDGRNDFFITFIEVLKDSSNIVTENNMTMGDYLHAFKTGLANALEQGEREVIQIGIPQINEYTLGLLVALYERAVAVYAEMININAFHQPGVQSYKLASGNVKEINLALQKFIAENKGFKGSVAEIAKKLSITENVKELEGILNKFVHNSRTFKNVSISIEYRSSDLYVSLN